MIFLPQLLILLFGPAIWMALTKGRPIQKWLSPVVLCYLTGILLANFPVLPLQENISELFVQLTIVFAIPLLLYGTDIKGWLKHAGSSVRSFVACVGSGILASAMMTFLLSDQVETPWNIAGMLVGVYTGGTPNLNAIGVMLEVDSNTLIIMNAADIFCGGLYLIFLTSVAHQVFSKFLRPYTSTLKGEGMSLDHNQGRSGEGVRHQHAEGELSSAHKHQIYWKDAMYLVGITILIIGITLFSSWLIFGHLEHLAFILLGLTTLSVMASLSPNIRSLQGSYAMGNYLLLVFCIAIGMQADFGHVLATGGNLILFTSGVLTTTVLLHLLICRWLKIDVDTAMITSTAALYGPAFVGQIASTIGNRSLIVAGMATGLVGYALGNYLGIGVATILQSLLS